MINYYILDESIGRYLKTSKTNHIIEMKMLTHKSGIFTEQDYQQYVKLIEGIKSGTLYSQFNLIDEQPLSIIDAFKMEAGHWYACRHNHVYNIEQVRIFFLYYIKASVCIDEYYHIFFSDEWWCTTQQLSLVYVKQAFNKLTNLLINCFIFNIFCNRCNNPFLS